MALSFSVFNKFRAIDKVSAPVRKMEKSTRKFGKTTTRAFKRADIVSKGFAKRLKSMAALAATLISITAVTAGLTDAVRVGVEFEQTLVNAAAKFGPTAKRGTANFKALEDAAAKAGKSTEFSATQAAEGLNFLAMAGFNVDQSIAALPGVIDLATAANIELGLASDIATDTLGAFNLAVKDSVQLQKNLARVSDVMAKATTTANVDMEQLFETFTEAGPIATSLGASIETVAALAGTLGNAGIKASKAGNTLKNVFTKLAAATPVATKRLDELGITLKDGSGNFRDVFDILEDLNTGLSDLGDVEKAAILNDIFGKIPIAGVNVLLKTGAKGLREYRTELENSTGAARTMAETMRDTIGNRFKIFQSTLEGFKITIFKLLSKQIDFAAKKLTNLVKISDEWLTLNKDKINVVLINVAASFAAVWSIIQAVIDGFIWLNKVNSDFLPTLQILIGLFVAWKTVMLLLNVVMAVTNAIMAANPIGLFILAVAGAILAIRFLIKHWDEVKKAFENPFIVLLLGPLGLLMKLIIFITDNLKAFKEVWQDISNIFKGDFPALKDMIELITTMSKLIASDIGGKVKSFLGFGNQEKTRPETAPVSSNAGMIQTIREEKNNKSSVDVNFNNLPQGTEINETGDVSGFNLKLGFSGAS